MAGERAGESIAYAETSVSPSIATGLSFASVTRWFVLVAVAVIPLFIVPTGWEPFRLPKDSAFVLIAAILFVIVAAATAAGKRRDVLAPLQPWLFGAIAAWATVCAIAATQKILATRGLVLVLATVLFAAVAETVVRRQPISLLAVPIIPATLNAALFVLQELDVWNPLYRRSFRVNFAAASGVDPETQRHSFSTALLGNPTDVACLLVPVAILLFAAGFSARRWKFAWLLGAAALTATVVLTQVLTAVIALAVAIAAMLAMRFRRQALIVTPVVITAVLATGFFYAPFKARLIERASLLARGELDTALSGRFPGFSAAFLMGADHPLLGVGPGCFGYGYFDARLRASERYPSLRQSAPINFGEAHNDYLDVFAETGVVGVALLIAALVILARGSRPLREGVDAEDVRVRFARTASLPLAVGFAVLALAQFPLSLPATMLQFLFVAALCRGWTRVA